MLWLNIGFIFNKKLLIVESQVTVILFLCKQVKSKDVN